MRRELPVLLIESQADMERLQGVDAVLLTWSKTCVTEDINSVLGALTAAITAIIVAIFVRSVACVCCRLESPLVTLLEVKLGAQHAAHSIGVAVKVAICALKTTILGLSRSIDEVERVHAAALMSTQVNVPLDASAEKVRSEEVWLI